MENPRIIKMGDQVITNYVDEKTGKIAVYQVGIKLEVSDFSGKWYPAKIVDVDNNDKEVLVHFENWSTRFDEWIKMDSNRLRPSPNTNIIKTQFKIGEDVEALWNTDGQKYAGVIQSVLPNDYYQVLFEDGIKLKKKYNQIFKVKPTTRASTSTGSTTPSIPGLPELTPISQLVSTPSGQIAPVASKNGPPPLQPKPGVKALRNSENAVKSLTDVSTAAELPKIHTRRRTSQSPPVISPIKPLDPSATETDEPTSSKRRRTVTDYSALLKIRRRFSYRETTDKTPSPRSSSSRRNRNSEPPELFPEITLPTAELSVEESKPELEDTGVSAPESYEIELESTENQLEEGISQVEPKSVEGEVQNDPVEFDVNAPAFPLHPPKPKNKAARRKFFTGSRQRRRSKRPPIRYVVMEEDEVNALESQPGGFSKPNTVPGTPETASLIEGQGSQSPVPSPDGVEPRIIKRRRRGALIRMQQQRAAAAAAEAAAAAGRDPSESPANPDEVLSKRKRTIHDYSMLLKIRPKFFFDIDEEQKRPTVARVGRRHRHFNDGRKDFDAVSPSSSTPPSVSDNIQHLEQTDEFEEKRHTEVTVGTETSNVADLPQTAIDGSTSVATHRPIRRSSSQFARKGYVPADELPFTVTKHSDTGLKGTSVSVVLEPLQNDYKGTHENQSTPGSGTGRKSDSLIKSVPPEKKTQLGSRLNQIDFNNSDFGDEDLLDVSEYTSLTVSSVPKCKIAPPPLPSVPSTSSIPKPISSRGPLMKTSKEHQARRRGRFTNNRWWKKRPSLRRSSSVISDENQNGDSVYTHVPKPTPIPRARKSMYLLRKRRNGDLLSGLTLRRIKTIRSNLHKRGFKKRIIAEPALKDVSVDIISCICGSTDEHGLMVQCEYCQCWQHGQCFEIETVDDMPKNYVCEACLCPDNVRTKMVTDYPYAFYKSGRADRFLFGPLPKPKATKLLQDTNTLLERLYQVRDIIYTSRVHTNIMDVRPDHPKLYQWDKPHTTIREKLQERKYNKVYRPLLRRLLFFNRDNPNYVEQLRSKIESVVKRRTFEERQQQEQRINEKLGILSPSPKKGSPQKNNNSPSQLIKPKPYARPPVPPMEAIRIRKELEKLNQKKNQELAMKIRTVTPKDKELEKKIDPAVLDVMDSMLVKLEESQDIQHQPTVEIDNVKPESEEKDVNLVLELVGFDEVKIESSKECEEDTTQKPVENNIGLDMPLIEDAVGNCSDVSEIPTKQTNEPEVSSESTPSSSIFELKEVELAMGCVLPPETGKLEQDIMVLDPSADPKFTEILKSESFIKILESLPSESLTVVSGTTPNLEGGQEDLEEATDCDLLNFLDEAMNDAIEIPEAKPSTSSACLPSTSATFALPPPPPQPITLTRITPELCRGNLMLTIMDQQKIIDQHLDEIEAKLGDLEKLKTKDPTTRKAALLGIASIQTKVQKMMKELELMKSMGRRAEHELFELIRLDPSRLDTGSASEPETEGVDNTNEETDTVEEEEDEDATDEYEDD